MDKFKQINKIVETTNTTDFRIQYFDGANLLLVGSFDFTYYHDVEIEFYEVSYINLPTDFEYPHFRIANSEEIEKISELIYVETEDTIYCIEAGTSSSINKLPFFLVAQRFEIREGIVYYYYRENLNKNEKIANWVKIDK